MAQVLGSWNVIEAFRFQVGEILTFLLIFSVSNRNPVKDTVSNRCPIEMVAEGLVSLRARDDSHGKACPPERVLGRIARATRPNGFKSRHSPRAARCTLAIRQARGLPGGGLAGRGVSSRRCLKNRQLFRLSCHCQVNLVGTGVRRGPLVHRDRALWQQVACSPGQRRRDGVLELDVGEVTALHDVPRRQSTNLPAHLLNFILSVNS